MTQTAREALLKALRQGLTFAAAATAGGIHEDTLKTWRKKGQEQKSGQYVDFFAELTRAKEEGRLELEKRLFANAREDGRLIMTILERRYPADWGKQPDQLNVGLTLPSTIQVQIHGSHVEHPDAPGD